MDLNTQYYEGIDNEREKQRIDYYNRVLNRFNINYCDDSLFLQDLSLEAYKEIYEMIIDEASYDEIREYMNSIG